MNNRQIERVVYNELNTGVVGMVFIETRLLQKGLRFWR